MEESQITVIQASQTNSMLESLGAFKEEACFSQRISNAPNHNPDAFTTAPKSGKRKTNKRTKQHAQSIAVSMLSSIELELGLKGLFEGELTHTSFDCPMNLREAFKHACKAEGTSVCDELQKYMANYVLAFQTKKHALGNTMSRLVDSKITVNSVFEQYCQTRPRRWIPKSVDEVKACTAEGEKTLGFCQFGRCREVAVTSGVYKKTGKEHLLCSVHAMQLRPTIGWKVN